MGSLVFTHAFGREVYGDEPLIVEEWLSGDGGRDRNGVESVCDPNNLIERRVARPQFGADGRLVLPRHTDLTNGTGLAAFMDCLIERRPYCRVNGPRPAQAMRTQIPAPSEHARIQRGRAA